MPFIYRRTLQFYETDAMGIIHHAIYLHVMEEARVALLRNLGLLTDWPLTKINYPVLSVEVEYKHPLYFEDEVEVHVQSKVERARLIFEYKLVTKRFSDPVAFGKTSHAAMEMGRRKIVRLPEALQKALS